MRNFSNINLVNYKALLGTRAIKFGTISGVAVPVTINWMDYGASTANPNVSILADFETPACTALDQIRSVYIDNLGSSVPIYVYFPDTGYTVSAKPNSEGWYPAFTNAKQIWIIGEGFFTGNIPSTLVLVSNIPLYPSVNSEIDTATALYLASSNITRGTNIFNTNFGTPALGDQFTSAILNTETDGQIVRLFQTPRPSGFIYVTSCYVSVQNFLNTSNSVVANNQFFFESTGLAGVFLATALSVQPSQNIPQVILLNIQGQWKLDATQTYQWRNQVESGDAQGAAVINLSYTTNPN